MTMPWLLVTVFMVGATCGAVGACVYLWYWLGRSDYERPEDQPGLY